MDSGHLFFFFTATSPVLLCCDATVNFRNETKLSTSDQYFSWCVTAVCYLIPANWDFSHISTVQIAFSNEHSSIHSLICGWQQESRWADLHGPGWSALNRTQLNSCSSPALCRRSRSSELQIWPIKDKASQGQVPESTTLDCPLHTSAVPSGHQPLQVWPCSGLARLPVVSQGSLSWRLIVAAADQWQRACGQDTGAIGVWKQADRRTPADGA